MPVSGAVERVVALQDTVRECLAALDGASPHDPEVGAAFERLNEEFGALGDPSELLRSATAEERPPLEEALSDLTRLHAVLTAAVARDYDRLACLLERSRASRAALRRAAPPGRAGATLDRSA